MSHLEILSFLLLLSLSLSLSLWPVVVLLKQFQNVCHVPPAEYPEQLASQVGSMPVDIPQIQTEEFSDEAQPAEELFDPWCDPANPQVIQFQDISAAAFKIKSGIMMTPCTRSHISSMTGCQIFFKKDFLQYTGSFKVNLKRRWVRSASSSLRRHGPVTSPAHYKSLYATLWYFHFYVSIPVVLFVCSGCWFCQLDANICLALNISNSENVALSTLSKSSIIGVVR